MSDSKVSSQQFMIKDTVFQFRRVQLLWKEDKFPLSINELFKHYSHSRFCVLVIDEANKLVQCFLVLGNWKRANCFSMSFGHMDTSCSNSMAQEFHFWLTKHYMLLGWRKDYGHTSAERGFGSVKDACLGRKTRSRCHPGKQRLSPGQTHIINEPLEGLCGISYAKGHVTELAQAEWGYNGCLSDAIHGRRAIWW